MSNIPDDDPDGGLNVRSYDGRKIATLPEGTVVYVTECEILDGGGIWWDVVTEAGIEGRVNSAFLDENIPPWVPTTGGNELADLVRTLLDALADENWGAATDVLAESGIETQLPLGAGPDLASQVAAYCERMICDAPYELVAVRGTYIPSRGSRSRCSNLLPVVAKPSRHSTVTSATVVTWSTTSPASRH